MLQGKIVWMCMVVMGCVYASEVTSNMETALIEDAEVYNAVSIVDQTKERKIDVNSSEVLLLKKKIKQLEAALSEHEETIPPEIPLTTKKVLKVPSHFFKGAKLKLGGEAPEYLSTYYSAKPQSLEMLEEKLKENGFTVLATTVINGKKVMTITNDALQKSNTFVSTLHLFVNNEEEILVQNPSYFGAAYLQGKYMYGQFSQTLKSLQLCLGDMYEIEDKLELDDLAKYHFMFGMPYFEDTITVAKGNNLLEKVHKEDANQSIAYTLKLPNGATIVGHKLTNLTYGFLDVISAKRKMNILPYESIIQEGKAVILDPKYYLALSLPLLHMVDFKKIASTPEEIEKEIKRAYK